MKMHNVFNVLQLKPYQEGNGDGTSPPPPVLDTDSEPELKIEHIVALAWHGELCSISC